MIIIKRNNKFLKLLLRIHLKLNKYKVTNDNNYVKTYKKEVKPSHYITVFYEKNDYKKEDYFIPTNIMLSIKVYSYNYNDSKFHEEYYILKNKEEIRKYLKKFDKGLLKYIKVKENKKRRISNEI